MKAIPRPCKECPWRVDAEQGRFTEERWDSLRVTSQQGDHQHGQLGDPVFACHVTKEGQEQACAGWLAVEGHSHVTVRYALLRGGLDPAALEPKPDWPELHPSFAHAAAHDLDQEVDLWT